MKRIKGLNLSTRQREIYNYCDLKDNNINTVVVSTGRQVGKTTVATQVSLNWCINYKQTVGFFMPTYKQCKKVFKTMQKGLTKLKTAVFNKSDLIITFANDASIQFLSTDSPDTIRGFTFGSIIVDEACFVRGDTFNEAILPTVAVSLSANKGKILLVSTPKTKNWFYDYFGQELPRKVAIKFTSEEGGLISKEILEVIKKTTPAHIYDNEYLGKFIESGNGLFAYKDCIIEKPSNFNTCIAAVDWGVEDDYTTLTIMNGIGELVFLKRWHHCDWMKLIKEIGETARKYHCFRLLSETNGIGNMPTKELAKIFPQTIEWCTTNGNKADIINKLSNDFYNKNIKILDIDYLQDELDSYTLEYNSRTGKVSYGARSGFHDDCVMGLAICNFNRLQSIDSMFKVGYN